MSGEDDVLSIADLTSYQWTYVEAPSDEELRASVIQKDNCRLEISCGHCKSDTTILKACKACHKVYYCNQTCQKNDWSIHKESCVYEKVKLKPDSRYPLRESRNPSMAKLQQKLQSDYHEILIDAFKGNFEILHDQGRWRDPPNTDTENATWIRNPKSTVLSTLERYQVRSDSPRTDNTKPISFKWRALESLDHGKGDPTACSFLELMDCYLLNDERYREGGIHYLAGSLEDAGLFWGMAINFNTFGTVAPFHSNCHCNITRLTKKHCKLRNKWDKIFYRAKADPLDIQCMYSETPVGCQNFESCPYKHEIEVIEKITKH